MLTGTLQPVSNAETWTETLEILDDEDGEPFDLADVEAITLKVRDPSNGSTALEGSLAASDILIVGDEADGTIEFTFTATAMSNLVPKTYEVGLLIETDDFTKQVILGRLPVLEGL